MRPLLLFIVTYLQATWNESCTSGSLHGLYAYTELLDEFSRLESLYPDYVLPTQISNTTLGLSYQRRSIPCYHLTAPYGPAGKSKTLVTAGHSASIPIGSSFSLYLMKKLLAMRADPLISFLLSVIRFSFIPLVNPDALFSQSLHFSSSHPSFSLYDTNANYTSCASSGVNINHNYGYMWGYDDTGSSAQPCDPHYRGVFPYSELETLAVASVVVEGGFSMGVNYDNMGNYYLRPVMYTKEQDKNAYYDGFQRRFYEGIEKDAGFPKQAKVGTMEGVLQGYSNGGLVDWLYSLDIPAFDVAIGPKGDFMSLTATDLQDIYDSHWGGFLAITERSSTYPR